MPDIQQQLKANAQFFENFLEDELSFVPKKTELRRPPLLLSAMRYAVLNGGKRLRPFLLLESFKLLQKFAPNSSDNDDNNMSITNINNMPRDLKRPLTGALYTSAALEFIHCYSLIHDDLPAMDNDDYRRGRPSVHKAYNEAIAILSGDALLTLAFELIAGAPNPLNCQQKTILISKLAQACGCAGMVGGQMLDMQASFAPTEFSKASMSQFPPLKFEEQIIKDLQFMKTGLLFRFAGEAGAIIAQAPKSQQAIMAQFGGLIGQAFQLADDLLDAKASSAQLGKTAKKDQEQNKATLLALYGTERAEKLLKELIAQAISLLEPFKEKAATLRKLAQFIMLRDH